MNYHQRIRKKGIRKSHIEFHFPTDVFRPISNSESFVNPYGIVGLQDLNNQQLKVFTSLSSLVQNIVEAKLIRTEDFQLSGLYNFNANRIEFEIKDQFYGHKIEILFEPGYPEVDLIKKKNSKREVLTWNHFSGDIAKSDQTPNELFYSK